MWVICSKIKTAFFEQSPIQSCIWLPFHFHFQNRKILSTTWKGIERAQVLIWGTRGFTRYRLDSAFVEAFWDTVTSFFCQKPTILISNWSPSGTLSDGATVDGILKVKVVCRGSPAWFHFQYDFKLATMWKSIQRASMWYQYCRLLTKNEVTASQNASTNAQSSRYLVNPRVSQIKTWRSYRDR
jgi:hypothetical protein